MPSGDLGWRLRFPVEALCTAHRQVNNFRWVFNQCTAQRQVSLPAAMFSDCCATDVGIS